MGGLDGSRRATAWLVATLGTAALLWLGERLPALWSGPLRRLVLAVRPAGLPVVLVLVLAALLVTAVRAARLRRLPEVAGEEPLLSPLVLPPARARPPVVALAGLEPGCGASSLAFNLVVRLAVSGAIREDARVRRPRPICLLSEGTLSANLGVSPQALEEYLARNPYRLTPDLVDVAVRHPAGCELLCLPRRARLAEYLRLLLEELRRHYDAIVIDAAFDSPHLVELAADHAELMLLVGLPTARSTGAAGVWAERVWGQRRERRTILVVNRVSPRQVPPFDLTAGFLHRVQLVDDPEISGLDRRGIPWSLDVRLLVARQLAGMCQQLFPLLSAGTSTDAA